MIREFIATGATVEEARQAAETGLGAPTDAEVQFEVLAMPKKKMLGLFGGSPAEVKAYYDDGKAEPRKREPKKPEPRQSEQKKPEQKKAEQKKPEVKKPEVKKPEAKKNDVEPTVVIRSIPAQETARREIPRESEPEEKTDREPLTAERRKEVEEAALAYLGNLLRIMEVEAEITTEATENALLITLSGDALGPIVGRRGETLDALQYLTVLASNRGGQGYYRITLNTGNYREKREKTLGALAERMAEKVIRNQRNVILEPMNPYERRIIHTAVQGIERVTSWSIGEEPNRSVVIGPTDENGQRLPVRSERSRGGRGPRRDGRDRGRRDDRRRQSAPPVDPNRTPKKDLDDAPLYGRIDAK